MSAGGYLFGAATGGIAEAAKSIYGGATSTKGVSAWGGNPLSYIKDTWESIPESQALRPHGREYLEVENPSMYFHHKKPGLVYGWAPRSLIYQTRRL